MFRYSPEQGGFWTPDNLIDQSFPDGIASIPFRKSGSAQEFVETRILSCFL